MRRLWLVGMMGAGKSSVGRRAAARLEVPFTDTDRLVAARFGMPVAEIFAAAGEEAFREAEHDAVVEASTAEGIIATGGGVVLSDANVALMRESGTVVWLDAEPATLASRVGTGRSRPLLAGDASPERRLAEILADRRPRYEDAAHVRIVVDGRPGADIVEEVVAAWATSQTTS